jgi:hypothetical protein
MSSNDAVASAMMAVRRKPGEALTERLAAPERRLHVNSRRSGRSQINIG